MELYSEQGFEQTTVAQIAARAGLTERTCFRHFTDKREVLFAGSEELQAAMVAATAAAPAGAGPLEAVAGGLLAGAEMLAVGRAFSGRRQAIITANADLRERELIKLAGLAAALAEALRGRGVGEPAASLTAEAGMAVFRVAFERWGRAGDEGELADHIRAGLDELRAVAAA